MAVVLRLADTITHRTFAISDFYARNSKLINCKIEPWTFHLSHWKNRSQIDLRPWLKLVNTSNLI